MKLTKQSIEALRSENGGYSRAISDALGVAWPLVQGWKEKLIAEHREIPDDQYAKLLEVKNAHLTKKPKDVTPMLGFE